MECKSVFVVKTITGERLPDRVCSLPEGHEGHHKDAEGAYWLNVATLPYVAPLVPRHD